MQLLIRDSNHDEVLVGELKIMLKRLKKPGIAFESDCLQASG
jgi:hypothetical protein